MGLALVLSGCSSPETQQEKLLQTALNAEGNKAINAVARLEGQEHLAKVVVEAREEYARRNALQRLADPEVLDQILPIVVFDDNCWISVDAVRKTRDQSLLLRVAMEHGCERARFAALEEMTDQDTLRKIAMGLMPGITRSNSDTRSLSLRVLAVGRLEDQELLANIAAEDEDTNMRLAATRRLTDPHIRAWFFPGDTARVEDQALLEDIARHAKNMEVRIQAVSRLENRTLLLLLATSDQYGVSTAARARLTRAELDNLRPWMDPSATKSVADHALLMDIARESLSWPVRATAVEMLTDLEFLSDVAVNDGASQVRTTAVKQLVHPRIPGEGYLPRTALPQAVTTLLKKIAVEDEDGFVRSAAIEGLTDQNLLARIALKDDDFANRRKAALRLTEPSLRQEVGWWLFPEETEKLGDQTLLEKIAVEAADDAVRVAAVRSLANERLLARISVTDESWNVQHEAIRRVTDQVLLENIAGEHPDWRFATTKCAVYHAAFMINNRELLQRISSDPSAKKAKYARLKLALLNWGEPGFSFSISIQRITQQYEQTTTKPLGNEFKVPVLKLGESVVLEVFAHGTRIAAWRGKSSFPAYDAGSVLDYPIDINPDQIIAALEQDEFFRRSQ